jgi:hypothetical protein
MRTNQWMIWGILLWGAFAASQTRKVPILVDVTSQNNDAVTQQLGDDLKEEFLSSGSYTLASDRKHADVLIEVIGIGVIVGNNAVASAVVCLHPSGPNTAIYHTVSLVGRDRTHLIAHNWFTVTDQQLQHYLP